MQIAAVESDAQEDRKASRADLLLVATCALISLVDGFDTQAISFAAPTLGKEFGLSPQAIGTMFSAGLIGGLCGAPLTVLIEPKIGRRLFLLLCVTWFALGSVATALAPSGTALIAIRFLSGVGLGMAVPLLMGAMTDSVPRGIRARSLALVTCAIPGGALCAGVTAAAIIGQHGWRSMFWIGSALPLLLIPLVLVGVPESRGMAHSGAGGATDQRSTPLAQLRATLGEGGVALTVLLVANFASMLLAFSLMSWTPSFMLMKGLGQSDASLAGGLLNGGAMAAILTLGYLIDRIGATRIAVTTFSIGAVSLLTMAQIHLGARPTLIVISCVGFFVIGSHIGLNYLLAHSVSAPRRIVVMSIAMVLSRTGAGVGPFLFGTLVQIGWTPAPLLTLAACIAALIASLIFLAGRSRAGEPVQG